MSIITTAYFDRSSSSIDGYFTIRTVDTATKKIIKEFVRLPSRSGQKGFEGTSWRRRKSPIPFSSEVLKPYKLWIDKPLQKGQWAGARGIGAFYPISTENDRITILGSGGVRTEAGWHPENSLIGTECCIASLAETPFQKSMIEEVWDYFDFLKKEQSFIKLEVL